MNILLSAGGVGYACGYVANLRAMTKDPSKVKRCPECKRLVDASTMRPLSRTRTGGGLRYVCPDCYDRVTVLRKAVQEARRATNVP